MQRERSDYGIRQTKETRLTKLKFPVPRSRAADIKRQKAAGEKLRDSRRKESSFHVKRNALRKHFQATVDPRFPPRKRWNAFMTIFSEKKSDKLLIHGKFTNYTRA